MKTIHTLFGDIPITETELKVNGQLPRDIEQDALLNICTNDVTPFTHAFHKFPAKFIPQIPRWAISKYLIDKKKQWIFDPFCGSGTTLVEGLLARHNVVGIDIDPIACLISKVKTTPIQEKKVIEIFKYVEQHVMRVRSGKFKPACKTLEHWFKPEFIPILSGIRDIIDNLGSEFGPDDEVCDVKDLLLVCYSSILRRVSNADDESQKTYVSHTKIKTPEEPIPLFLKQLNFFRERVVQFSRLVDPSLIRRAACTSSIDKLSLLEELGQKFDLAITSPPYIKAIDYIYNQMVELFWIGDKFSLDTQVKQNEYKEKYVGTKQISKNQYSDFNPYHAMIGLKEIDSRIQRVFNEDSKNGHKHSYIVFRYFKEMSNHFEMMHKRLKQNAHYIFVVGDSTVSNVFFPTSEIFGALAQEHGFKLVNRWSYKIKNRFMRFDRKGRGGIILFDWVLDFERIIDVGHL